MNTRVACLSIVIACFLVAAAGGQVPQSRPGGSSPFAGRWEIRVLVPPDVLNEFEEDGAPFIIIDIAGPGSSLSGTLVASLAPPGMEMKLVAVSAKGDQLLLVLEGVEQGKPVRFKLEFKRIADRLEGTGAFPDGAKEIDLACVGSRTTRDTVVPPAKLPPAADRQAYAAAMRKPRAEQTAALTQFLKDYPDFRQKELAILSLAMSYQSVDEKRAALRRFLHDFPASRLKDLAAFQLTLTAPEGVERVVAQDAFVKAYPQSRYTRTILRQREGTAPTRGEAFPNAEEIQFRNAVETANNPKKAAALRTFMNEFPASRFRLQAEYELTLTAPEGAEREAAQDAFVNAHPKGVYTSNIYQARLSAGLQARPLDEARLTTLIDRYLAVSQDDSTVVVEGGIHRSLRGHAQNTVAVGLLTNGVMLDRALDLARQAVAAAGDRETPQTRAEYVTTLGRVLYTLKQYDEAEGELKRAIGIGGVNPGGLARLCLGQVYEASHNDDAALAAYLDAAIMAPSPLVTTSLERMYIKKHGSLAGLDETLKARSRTRATPFDPGRFTRAAAAAPSRVVLVERFTNAEFKPCVADDLAFDGLAERYDHATLAVLAYHLYDARHMRGMPDPLTSAGAEARADYYGVVGMPTSLVNGRDIQVGGGAAAWAASRFTGLTTLIESRLEAVPLATLTGFEAKVDGETMTVSGQAELRRGLAKKVKNARLRVALVEDMVRYTGANGLRVHGYVVRAFMGPPAGLPVRAPGKKTVFTASVNVTTLGQQLDTYLTTVEKAQSAQRGAFTFRAGPTRIDSAQLLVVAFVQDDQTKEILQSVVVTPSR